MKINFEYVTNLQYEVKALRAKLSAFESGDEYLRLKTYYEKRLKEEAREKRALKRELAASYAEIARMRNNWMQVFDDMEKEESKALGRKHKEMERMRMRAEKAEAGEAKWHGKWKGQQAELYEVQTQLEEAREMNRKLTAQVNRDFENSSIPSSMQACGRKKIPNSRVKTQRHPGGQPGHAGHHRKRYTPTQTHEIPTPAEYKDSGNYYETGKIIRKQKVAIELTVKVTEYTAKEYRSRITGARVHAPFPEGYINEVNYDSTVKALAFLLSSECAVSHGKIRTLLKEVTGGAIELSDGMINRLGREFSAKTGAEKQEILEKLMSSPVINADFTNANVNGKSAQVLVLASPSKNVAMYIGREKKGHEGIRGTPLESYVGIVVHDHDKTFYRYGTGHQECMQHNCRYLVGSCENEPSRKWNRQMHELIREMLHYRNSLGPAEASVPAVVSAFEERYDRILEKAGEEYEYEPPDKYYREGYNLYARMKEYKESELRFLHDRNVPANNSLCERLARVYKRKQKQAMVIRSKENLGYICDNLSTVYLLRSKGLDVYKEISNIFERKKPARPPKEENAGVVS